MCALQAWFHCRKDRRGIFYNERKKKANPLKRITEYSSLPQNKKNWLKEISQVDHFFLDEISVQFEMRKARLGKVCSKINQDRRGFPCVKEPSKVKGRFRVFQHINLFCSIDKLLFFLIIWVYLEFPQKWKQIISGNIRSRLKLNCSIWWKKGGQIKHPLDWNWK